MSNGDVAWDAFVEGADLPDRASLLGASTLGGSGREVVEALLARDHEQLDTLLKGDRALATASADDYSMLEVAVATGDPMLVELLIIHGAALDGDGSGGPLVLALHARTPALALALLSAGASATPPGAPLEPLRTAISLASLSGVRMLLDYGADSNLVGPLQRRPLHIALDMEQFRIAELLINRGADLWAIDASGTNLGTAVTTAMVTDNAEERAAQIKLSTRAVAAGWPDPAPTPAAILSAAQSGQWPPPRR